MINNHNGIILKLLRHWVTWNGHQRLLESLRPVRPPNIYMWVTFPILNQSSWKVHYLGIKSCLFTLNRTVSEPPPFWWNEMNLQPIFQKGGEGLTRSISRLLGKTGWHFSGGRVLRFFSVKNGTGIKRKIKRWPGSRKKQYIRRIA